MSGIISKKIFTLAKGQMEKIRNEQSLVSDRITEVKVDRRNGIIPIDYSAYFANLKNMFSGNAFYDIINDDVNLRQILYSIPADDFFIGMSDNRINDIADIYNDPNEAARVIVNDFVRCLQLRNSLHKEVALKKLFSDDNTFASTNVVDLTTTKISSWGEQNAKDLIGAITQLKRNFNKAVGGGLFDDKMNFIPKGIQCEMIIPAHIWAELTTNMPAFDKWLSTSGIGGDYRMITPELFKTLVGIDVYVGSSIQLNEAGQANNAYTYENAVEVWNDDNIYFYTTSPNLLDWSGFNMLKWKEMELWDNEMLGDLRYRAKVYRLPVLKNKYAMGKIKVKISD